jgi:hypothetical protein
MTPAERKLLDNAVDSPTWQRRFEDESVVELARAADRSRGRFNTVGHRAWWYGRDVDTTLLASMHMVFTRSQRKLQPVPASKTFCYREKTLA